MVLLANVPNQHNANAGYFLRCDLIVVCTCVHFKFIEIANNNNNNNDRNHCQSRGCLPARLGLFQLVCVIVDVVQELLLLLLLPLLPVMLLHIPDYPSLIPFLFRMRARGRIWGGAGGLQKSIPRRKLLMLILNWSTPSTLRLAYKVIYSGLPVSGRGRDYNVKRFMETHTQSIALAPIHNRKQQIHCHCMYRLIYHLSLANEHTPHPICDVLTRRWRC